MRDRAAFPDKTACFFRDEPDGPVRFYFRNPDRGMEIDGPASADDIRNYADDYARLMTAEATERMRAADAVAAEAQPEPPAPDATDLRTGPARPMQNEDVDIP